MKKLVILGAGGTASIVKDVIEAINNVQPTWQIVGALDDNPSLIGGSIAGIKVLGNIDEAKNYSDCYFISSIAHPQNRLVRRNIYDRAKNQGCKFATLIHPRAIVSLDAKVGEGCFIDANCMISGLVELEEDVFLLNTCSVSHESRICAHTTLSVNVKVSGGVVVGSDCYMGTNSSTAHDIVIANNNLIGMGSAVMQNIKTEGNTWVGVPAMSADKMGALRIFVKSLVKK